MSPGPVVSLIILNYNGAPWLDRCLESLRRQTWFDRMEVIIADNASRDGSDELAQKLLADWPPGRGRFHPNGGNLGFCAGNNLPARSASGCYLFFLNNDLWLEPDCVEKLITGLEALNADGGAPKVMNYSDNVVQTFGGSGLDWFGLATTCTPVEQPYPVFAWTGCAYLIRRDLFERIGGFDEALFMYADEIDLSWRFQLAGGRAFIIPAAGVHHRGEASVNPEGGKVVVELRTSDTKRFYANRNNLYVLLKNAQHLFLLLAIPHLLLLAAEALVWFAVERRWSFLREAYLKALAGVWKMRGTLFAERRRIAAWRQRSDFWMLRWLRLKPGRWDDLRRVLKLGLPKVTPRAK